MINDIAETMAGTHSLSKSEKLCALLLLISNRKEHHETH